MKTKIKIKVDAYDISAATGYKTGITVPEDGAVNDTDCLNNFLTNKYSPLPEVDGTTGLTAADQSSMFTKISYASIDEAKTALLSDTINTAISTYVDGTPTYSLDSGNLTIECYFTNADNLKSWSQAVTATNAWKITGVAVSHV